MCCCSPSERRHWHVQQKQFFEVVSMVIALLGGLVGFFAGLALVADGFFQPHTRFVYEFFEPNETNTVSLDCSLWANETVFLTVSQPLLGVWMNHTAVPFNGTLCANFSTTLPPGPLANSTWALEFPNWPGVTGWEVAWVSGFLIFLGWRIFKIFAWVDKLVAASLAVLAATSMALCTFSEASNNANTDGNWNRNWTTPVNISQALASYPPGLSPYWDAGLWLLFSASVCQLGWAVKKLFSASGREWEDATQASILPECVASLLAPLQIGLVIAKLTTDHGAAWGAVLVPAFAVLFINTCGWVVWFIVSCQELDDLQGRCAAVLLCTATVYVTVCWSLILVCINDGDAYDQMNQWPLTWVQVVTPFVGGFIFLVLVMLLQPLYMLALKCKERHDNTQRVRKKNKEEAEVYFQHQQKATTFGYEELPDGPDSVAQVTVEDTGDVLQSDHRSSDSDSFFACLRGGFRWPPCRDTDVQSQLKTLAGCISSSPGLATTENKALIISSFESLVESAPHLWTEEVKLTYQNLLRQFTVAYQMLQKSPSTKALRRLDMVAKPALPPEDDRFQLLL